MKARLFIFFLLIFVPLTSYPLDPLDVTRCALKHSCTNQNYNFFDWTSKNLQTNIDGLDFSASSFLFSSLEGFSGVNVVFNQVVFGETFLTGMQLSHSSIVVSDESKVSKSGFVTARFWNTEISSSNIDLGHSAAVYEFYNANFDSSHISGAISGGVVGAGIVHFSHSDVSQLSCEKPMFSRDNIRGDFESLSRQSPSCFSESVKKHKDFFAFLQKRNEKRVGFFEYKAMEKCIRLHQCSGKENDFQEAVFQDVGFFPFEKDGGINFINANFYKATFRNVWGSQNNFNAYMNKVQFDRSHYSQSFLKVNAEDQITLTRSSFVKSVIDLGGSASAYLKFVSSVDLTRSHLQGSLHAQGILGSRTRGMEKPLLILDDADLSQLSCGKPVFDLENATGAFAVHYNARTYWNSSCLMSKK